jgi:hypothetical protein
MVRAAMLFSAPANPLSLTATAMSASEGATVGDGTPASWRLASMAFLTSSRKAEDLSSTMCAMIQNSKENNQTEKERKMSKSKENAKKKNRNQGKIQRYIYRE